MAPEQTLGLAIKGKGITVMIRNFKALGIAVIAALAMSAVVASAASADNFTAASYPAEGSGGQTTTHEFTVQGSAVKCAEAKFTGTLAAANTYMTVSPEYKKCQAFGFLEATVSMNGCTYKFDAGTGGTGSVEVVCPSGQTITVVAATCTVHIPPQTPTTPTVNFKNEGEDVLVTSAASGIHSNVTSGFLCPLSSNSTDTSGKYTGDVTFEGDEGADIHIGHHPGT